MTARERLTAKQAASLVGVRPSTWSAYVARGHAPKPDGRFGNANWWYRSTIEKWERRRPGQGARTDLHGTVKTTTQRRRDA